MSGHQEYKCPKCGCEWETLDAPNCPRCSSFAAPPGYPSTKLYQITEDDLATLEAELPRLLEVAMATCNDPLIRKRWEAVKAIVANVRWNYGPPREVQNLDG